MSTVTTSVGDTAVDHTSAKSVFTAWERLRLVFNATLVLLVMVVASTLVNREQLAEARFWRFLIKAAIGANVCFCSGFVVEGYLVQVGVPRRVSRPILFAGGLIVSACLAYACVAMWGWGDD